MCTIRKRRKKGFTERTKNMLTGKWTLMNTSVLKFNQLVEETAVHSGENDDDHMSRVHTLYDATVGGEFKHRSAWLFLKGKHKWTNSTIRLLQEEIVFWAPYEALNLIARCKSRRDLQKMKKKNRVGVKLITNETKAKLREVVVVNDIGGVKNQIKFDCLFHDHRRDHIAVRNDAVVVHSVKAADGADIEAFELFLLAKGLNKVSSFGSYVVRNASSRTSQVLQNLKRLASLSERRVGRLEAQNLLMFMH
ncbi:hypothetical protein Tco_1001464 [Tanacetum coccineum]